MKKPFLILILTFVGIVPMFSQNDCIQQIGSISETPALGLGMKDNNLFITNEQNQLKVYDISDPTNPLKKTQFNYSGSSSSFGLEIEGNYAYILGGLSRIFLIIDITDINLIKQLGAVTFPFNGGHDNVKCCINDNYAYVTNGDSIFVIDIADKNNPKIIHSNFLYGVNHSLFDIKLHNKYLFVGSDSIVSIFDISLHHPFKNKNSGRARRSA